VRITAGQGSIPGALYDGSDTLLASRWGLPLSHRDCLLVWLLHDAAASRGDTGAGSNVIALE
jgi:hypothetical protein